MAQLPTDDENARIVLDIFGHFGTRPGEVIMPQNVMALMAKRGWRKDDIVAGFEIAAERGWVEDGPNGSIRLTQAGFTAV